MIKRTTLILIFETLLFSCAPGKSLILKRPLGKITTTENSANWSFEEELPKLKEGENILISPVSWKINEELMNSYNGQSNFLENFESSLNVEGKYTKLQSSPFLFSTLENISEKKHEWLKENYVSTFWGDRKEIETGFNYFLKDITDDDFKATVDNPGLYYGNILYVEDSFSVEKQASKGIFTDRNGSSSTASFVKDKEYLKVYQDDEKIIVDLPISSTTLRLGMKKDFSFLPFQELQIDVERMALTRVNYSIPEFAISSSYFSDDPNSEDARFQSQMNSFRFTKTGILGKSFTFNGPTADSPDYELDFNLDHPFSFASYYKDMVLYSGNVEML